MSELHSIEMEMSTIGSMMLDSRAVVTARGIVNHRDFFRQAHQLLFVALCQLAEKGPVDPVLIKHALEREKVLEVCGGETYLIEIMEYVPSAANVEYYATQVKELSERRETAKYAADVLRAAQDTETGIEEVRAARSALAELRGGGSPFKAFAQIAVNPERRRGASTGFESLDESISTGGYPAGQMSVVSAYHKGKKTSFMLSSMVAALQAGKRCLFATFADLGEEDLKERMVRNLCGYSREPSVTWAQEQFREAWKAVDAMRGGIYDASSLESGDDIETFAAWFRAEHSKEPFDVAYLDYAQKLTSRDKRAVGDLAMPAMVSRKICRLAASSKVPFVLASQITKGSVKDGRDAMTKGSRVWEEDCAWCLRIGQEGDGDAHQIEIAYSRFGEQGKVIPLAWNRTHLKFEE